MTEMTSIKSETIYEGGADVDVGLQKKQEEMAGQNCFNKATCVSFTNWMDRIKSAEPSNDVGIQIRRFIWDCELSLTQVASQNYRNAGFDVLPPPDWTVQYVISMQSTSSLVAYKSICPPWGAGQQNPRLIQTSTKGQAWQGEWRKTAHLKCWAMVRKSYEQHFPGLENNK